MSTKARKKANRKNAKKSTGPKTTEGKEKSSQNAVKHGFFACHDVIRTENQVDYDMFRGEMLEEFNPIGPMQYRLADRIVSLSWRLKRAEQIHNHTIEYLLAEDDSYISNPVLIWAFDPHDLDPDLALGRIVEKDFAYARVLDRIMMYERRIENSLYKTIKELKNLKKEKTQNEPNFKHSANVGWQRLSEGQAMDTPKNEGQSSFNQRDALHASQDTINMQNEPNSQDHMNVSPAISEDYDLAQPGELLQKMINKVLQKTDSTNNQLKGSISKRNQGRSEAYNHPIRPQSKRLNKK